MPPASTCPIQALDVLCSSKEVQVREWIEGNQNIIELMKPLQYRDEYGDRTTARIKLERTQQKHAAHSCEFHASKKGSAFAELEEEESDHNAWPTIDQDMLKKATTRQLEQTAIWCKAELNDREGLTSFPPSAKKRRRP
ncbi:hypothetical protein DL767_008811 [Monosporascus sp. MG133]|nr:hypothetical protein DL767_008811 [Monosporascus sp. MG133]